MLVKLRHHKFDIFSIFFRNFQSHLLLFLNYYFSDDSVKHNKLKLNNQKQIINNLVYNNISVNNNNNNNDKNSDSNNSDLPKSILENCLAASSSSASTLNPEESQNGNMDENNHKQHSVIASTSSFEQMENRKVEPLKINLHREPIKTVIKLPQPEHPPKIIIKPIKPQDNESIPTFSLKQINYPDDVLPPPPSEMHIIPKLHIGSNAEHAEPHIVPKLTIRGVQGASQQVNHHSVLGESKNKNISY